MFGILFIVASALGFTQQTTYQNYELSVPAVSSGTDLLIILTKDQNSSPLLFLGSILGTPSFSFGTNDDWVVSADYDDFQGWMKNSNPLLLRIEYAIASRLSNIYLLVYMRSGSSINYQITFSSISVDSCEHGCVYGQCSSGVCSCTDNWYMGYDCSIALNTLVVNYNYVTDLQPYNWGFALVSYSSASTINLDLEDIMPGTRIFEIKSRSGQELPSMINNDAEYWLGLGQSSNTFTINTSPLPYWVWGIYCYSNSECKANLKLYYPSSSSSSFMWIIIATIISLALICIATPIILRMILKFRERNEARVAVAQVESRKDQLRQKYPDEKYVEQEEKASCIICFEDFSEGCMVRKLNCTHTFHSKCIDEWYLNNNKCPLCKRDMFDANLDVSEIA